MTDINAVFNAISPFISNGAPPNAVIREAISEALTIRPSPEQLARRFHETYERLAPSFGYRTRKPTAVSWEDVPQQNKALMVAVAIELLSVFAMPMDSEQETDSA